MLKFIHKDDIQHVASDFRTGFLKGKASTELRIRHNNGAYIWLETKGKTFIDKHGVKKAILISRDITDKKMAEQKLRESEERYRLINENSGDVIWSTDMNLNLTYVSPNSPKY